MAKQDPHTDIPGDGKNPNPAPGGILDAIKPSTTKGYVAYGVIALIVVIALFEFFGG